MSPPFLSETGALILAIILTILSTIRWFGLLLHHYGRVAYHTNLSSIAYRNLSRISSRTTLGRGFHDIFVLDVAVILPVVDHQSENFMPTVKSILENIPGQLYVMVVGREAYDEVMPQIEILRRRYQFSQIHVGAVHEANKRRQIAHALKTLHSEVSSLTVITEQGTYWPTTLLDTAVRMFEDGEIAAVTVPRMAHIPPSGGVWANIKAHLFSFHYCAQAEDNRAVNSLDGSALFGGPTTMVRTYHLKDSRFREEFEKEMWFFDRFGPLTGDEHFYLNRYLLGGNKKTFFLDCPEATVSVEMNSVCGFISEFFRTIRNNWRTCYFMAPHCAWLYFRWRHVIFPAASRMTWWPTIFFPVPLLIDILSMILALNYSILNKAALYVWIIVVFLVVSTQAISNLSVARRIHGKNRNVFATSFCVLTDVKRTLQDVNVPKKKDIPWNWGYWGDLE